MIEYENGYDADLRDKKVCRFCLAQDTPLTNIYSNNSNAQIALSMQIMVCSSIEVFADDDMPATICDLCRTLMEYWYQFKKMCKTADTKLKQFPLTGMLPEKLAHPTYPNALLKTTKGPATSNQQANKRKQPATIQPAKKFIKTDIDDIPIEDMVVEFADDSEIYEEHAAPFITADVYEAPIKVLNKRSITAVEPVLRAPIIKQGEDGKIEIITKFMNQDELDLEGLDDEIEIDDRSLMAVETNVFPCKHCERSFPLRQLLELHEANHVRDRKFQCDTCQKSFFSKYDLAKHLLVHTGEKPFKCIICGKGFSRSTLLRRHERVHSDQPKFLCEFCERSFLSKEEWEKHTDNHQKKRPFECEMCGKSFAFKQGLERHEVVHSVDQPFRCEHCDEGFSTQGKLARHLTQHAGLRPYPCRICDKSYLLSHHLTRHMRSHKEANQTFKCSVCDAVFKKRNKLIMHSAIHAADNYTCSLCKETFESAVDVEEHIKLHNEGEQYACEFCDLMFLTPEQLQDHSVRDHIHDIEMYETDIMTTSESHLTDYAYEESAEGEESIIDYESVEIDDSGEQLSPEPVKVSPKPRTNAKVEKPQAKQVMVLNVTNSTKQTPSPKSAAPSPKPSAPSPKSAVPSPKEIRPVLPVIKPVPVTKPATKSAPSSQAKSNAPVASPKSTTTSVVKNNEAAKKLLPVKRVETNTVKLAQKGKEPVAKVTSAKKSPPQSSIKTFMTVKTKPAGKAEPLAVIAAASTSTPQPSAPPVASSLPIITTTTTTTKTPSTPLTLTKVTRTAAFAAAKAPAVVQSPSQPKPAATNDATKPTNLKALPKQVKVQHVRMTKADIEALRKEGKIEIQNGKMILKQNVALPKK